MNIIKTIFASITVAVFMTATANAAIKGYIKISDIEGKTQGAEQKDQIGIQDVTWTISPNGSGVMHITLKRGYTASVDHWFKTSKARGSLGGGSDLHIINNDADAAFAEAHCTAARVTKYTASRKRGGKTRVACGKLIIIYTKQADDHSAG